MARRHTVTVTAPALELLTESDVALLTEADESLTTGYFNAATLTVTVANRPTVEVS